MRSIDYATKIVLGENSLSYLSTFQQERIFIVADPFIVESGLIELVTRSFQKNNQLHIFKEVTPDPPVENVVAGMMEFTSFKGTMILAIGGGSAIDLGKGIKYFSQVVMTGPKPICVVLPTTSGAGSEVTSFAVITDLQKGVKYPLVSPSIVPDVAILAGELVAGLPAVVVADSGIDVLTHAIEAFVSTSATSFSDAFAEKAFKLVFKYLARSFNDPDDQVAKMRMHEASCMAGLAFNDASLGLTHGIAHSAGAQYHIPHGRMNSLLLPAVMSFNAELEQPFRNDCFTRQRYAELALSIGLKGQNNGESVRMLLDEIDQLQQALNLPQTLTETGLSSGVIESSLPVVINSALKDSCTRTNPRSVTGRDIEKLIHEIS